MVDLRSKKKEVENDKRKDPRLEFHCEVKVLGIDRTQKITDLSLGGIFIETNRAAEIRKGQIITVGTKLPTDKNVLKFKAKVIYQVNRGIGCEFIELKDREKQAICLCFEMFKDTLPAGCK